MISPIHEEQLLDAPNPFRVRLVYLGMLSRENNALIRHLAGPLSASKLLAHSIPTRFKVKIFPKAFRLRIARVLLLTAAAFLAPAVLSAQTPPANASLTTNPVFEKQCAKCHGKTAEGRHFGGPALISEKVAAATPEDLTRIINNGKGHMPKYADKLKPEEIDSLVQQIKAANKK
jgi:mono/diheme cytochrome c family protein